MQQKERIPTLCDSMDGYGKHYAKWNKPDSERQIPCGLTNKWPWQTSEQNKTRDMKIKNKLTVSREEEEGV